MLSRFTRMMTVGTGMSHREEGHGNGVGLRYKVYKAGQGSKDVGTCSVRFEATPSLSSERILWDAQEPSLKLPTPSVSLCSRGPAEISAQMLTECEFKIAFKESH